MKDLKDTCKIAVVQAAPVLFDKAACTEKAAGLIQKAAEEQAELIVFPELFIPGYPYGMTFGFTVGSRGSEGRKDWKMYHDNSILVPGKENALGVRRKKRTLMSALAFRKGMLSLLLFTIRTCFFRRKGNWSLSTES